MQLKITKMLKSKLQKFSGLKYENLKENIVKAIEIIPKEYYKNILEGAYNINEKYVLKNKTRKKNQERCINNGRFIPLKI